HFLPRSRPHSLNPRVSKTTKHTHTPLTVQYATRQDFAEKACCVWPQRSPACALGIPHAALRISYPTSSPSLFTNDTSADRLPNATTFASTFRPTHASQLLAQ